MISGFIDTIYLYMLLHQRLWSCEWYSSPSVVRMLCLRTKPCNWVHQAPAQNIGSDIELAVLFLFMCQKQCQNYCLLNHISILWQFMLLWIIEQLNTTKLFLGLKGIYEQIATEVTFWYLICKIVYFIHMVLTGKKLNGRLWLILIAIWRIRAKYI